MHMCICLPIFRIIFPLLDRIILIIVNVFSTHLHLQFSSIFVSYISVLVTFIERFMTRCCSRIFIKVSLLLYCCSDWLQLSKLGICELYLTTDEKFNLLLEISGFGVMKWCQLLQFTEFNMISLMFMLQIVQKLQINLEFRRYY